MTISADEIYDEIAREELEAGTGFMPGLAETMQILKEYGGYTRNLSMVGDHFECDSGAFKLYPADLIVEKVYRFENSSDPDDSSILYAISDPTQNLRGLYVDAYGIHQGPIFPELLQLPQ